MQSEKENKNHTKVPTILYKKKPTKTLVEPIYIMFFIHVLLIFLCFVHKKKGENKFAIREKILNNLEFL